MSRLFGQPPARPAPPPAGPLPPVPVPPQTRARPAAAALSAEYVAGGAGVQLGGYLRSLPAWIDPLTRSFGDDLYERMLLDFQCHSSVKTLSGAALAEGLTLHPAVDDEKDPDFKAAKTVCDFCCWTLDRMEDDGEALLRKMLWYPALGNRVAEQVYAEEPVTGGAFPGTLPLEAVRVKPRRAYSFVVDGFLKLVGLKAAAPGSGGMPGGSVALDAAELPNVLPREKFFVLSWDHPDGDPRGGSILRAAYENWFQKRQLAGELLKHLTQFGSPSVFGTVGPDAARAVAVDELGNPTGEPDRDPVQEFLTALLNWRNGTAVVGPHGSEAKLLQSASAAPGFLAALDYHDRAIAKAVLLATRATMEAKHGSKADSETAQDVTGNEVRQLKRAVGRAFSRQVLYPLVAYNYGRAAADRLTPKAVLAAVEHQDWTAVAASVAPLVASGFIKPSQFAPLYERLGLPPADPEELKPPAPVAAPAYPPPEGGAAFADYDPAQHPHRGPGPGGGQFAPKGGGEAAAGTRAVPDLLKAVRRWAAGKPLSRLNPSQVEVMLDSLVRYPEEYGMDRHDAFTLSAALDGIRHGLRTGRLPGQVEKWYEGLAVKDKVGVLQQVMTDAGPMAGTDDYYDAFRRRGLEATGMAVPDRPGPPEANTPARESSVETPPAVDPQPTIEYGKVSASGGYKELTVHAYTGASDLGRKLTIREQAKGSNRYEVLGHEYAPDPTGGPGSMRREETVHGRDLSLRDAKALARRVLLHPRHAPFAFDPALHPRGQPANRGQFGPKGGDDAHESHAALLALREAAARGVARALGAPGDLSKRLRDASRAVLDAYREGGAAGLPRRAVRAAARKAVSLFRRAEDRYGRPAAVAMAAAYLGTYAAYVIEPRSVMFMPYPSGALVGVAEAVRRLLRGARAVAAGPRLTQFAFDPEAHPHQPAGSHEGGQFAPKGGGGAGSGSGKPPRYLHQQGEKIAGAHHRNMIAILKGLRNGDYDPDDAAEDARIYEGRAQDANRTAYAARFRKLRDRVAAAYGTAALESPQWRAVRDAFRKGRERAAELIEKAAGAVEAVAHYAARPEHRGEPVKVSVDDYNAVAGTHDELVESFHKNVHEVADAMDAFRAAHKPLPGAAPFSWEGDAARFAGLPGAFDETQHPRGQPANAGQFGPGGGGGKAADAAAGDAAPAPAPPPPAPPPAVYEGDAAATAKAIFGRDVSPQELGAMSGAIPGASVSISAEGQHLDVKVSHAEYGAFRQFYRDGPRIICQNHTIRAVTTGTGLGTRVFASQVDALAKGGVAEIRASAKRDDAQGWNGYATWPKLGYNGKIPEDVRGGFLSRLTGGGLPKALRDAKDLLDLTRSKEGRDWWEQNGKTVKVGFDLAEGSPSRNRLAEYVARKAAKGPANG